MLKKFLNIEGVTLLDKEEQIEIKGGNPLGFALNVANYTGCAARAAMDVQDALLYSPFLLEEDQQEIFDETFEACMDSGIFGHLY